MYPLRLFRLPVIGLLTVFTAIATPGMANTLCLETAQGTEAPLRVELADEPKERSRGLMERDHLEPDAGMLFLYRELQGPEQAFWMYRTRIPLAIAFIGPGGQIRAIRNMTPCRAARPADCRSYPAGVEFRSALEVNEGWFGERGIREGHRVRLAGERGCRTASRSGD